MRGRRRPLSWVFVAAAAFALGGLLVMHGIDGSHATPDMSMASPAASAAGASVAAADRSVGDAGGPGSGMLSHAATACVAVLITVAAAAGLGAALARAHPRVARRFSLSATIGRAAQTAWRPAAPAAYERCVLIC